MATIRFKAFGIFNSEECILSERNENPISYNDRILEINRSKMNKYYLPFLFVALAAFFGGCKKDATVGSDSLYTPTIANVTANATLQELQTGRTLYVNNCNNCHGLYLPENYSVTQWKSILSTMGPRTGMPSSDLLLVTKYVCKGNQ